MQDWLNWLAYLAGVTIIVSILWIAIVSGGKKRQSNVDRDAPVDNSVGTTPLNPWERNAAAARASRQNGGDTAPSRTDIH